MTFFCLENDGFEVFFGFIYFICLQIFTVNNNVEH